MRNYGLFLGFQTLAFLFVFIHLFLLLGQWAILLHENVRAIDLHDVIETTNQYGTRLHIKTICNTSPKMNENQSIFKVVSCKVLITFALS